MENNTLTPAQQALLLQCNPTEAANTAAAMLRTFYYSVRAFHNSGDMPSDETIAHWLTQIDMVESLMRIAQEKEKN